MARRPKLTPQTPCNPLHEPPPRSEAETEAAPAEMPIEPTDLPDQSEIDPGLIEQPLLTKQGWVVPHKAAS